MMCTAHSTLDIGLGCIHTKAITNFWASPSSLESGYDPSKAGFEISVDYRDYRQILPIPMTTDISNR